MSLAGNDIGYKGHNLPIRYRSKVWGQFIYWFNF